MSFAAESWAWDQQCGDGIAKSVLAYLSFRASRRTAECWPSLRTIVRAVEHTERAVRKALAGLVKAGKVERERRYAASGRCISTLYRLPVTAEPVTDSPAEPTPANSQETPPLPTPANSQDKPSSKKDSTEEEREAAPQAAPPAPEAGQDILLVKEEEPASPPPAHKTPWPDEPPLEIVQLVLEAGYEPDELLEEIADWCRDRDRKSADWPAFTRRWVRRQKRFDADKGKVRNSFIAKILEERGAAPWPASAGGIVIDGMAEPAPPPPPPRARAAPPYEPWKMPPPRAASDEEPSRFQAPARSVAEQIAALGGGPKA